MHLCCHLNVCRHRPTLDPKRSSTLFIKQQSFDQEKDEHAHGRYQYQSQNVFLHRSLPFAKRVSQGSGPGTVAIPQTITPPMLLNNKPAFQVNHPRPLAGGGVPSKSNSVSHPRSSRPLQGNSRPVVSS